MLKRRKARALSSLQDRQATLAQEQLLKGFVVAEPQPAHSRLAQALDFKDAREIRANIYSSCSILSAVAACEYLGFTVVNSSTYGREWLCLLPALGVFVVCAGSLLLYLSLLGTLRSHAVENLLDRGLYVAVFDQTLSDPPPSGIWAKFFQKPIDRLLRSDSLVKRISALVEYFPRLAGNSGLEPLPMMAYVIRLVLSGGVVLALSVPLLLSLYYFVTALVSGDAWRYGSNTFNVAAVLAYIIESGGGPVFLPVMILLHIYLALIGLRLFGVIERAAVRQAMNAIVNS